jgi:hypothetical protein
MPSRISRTTIVRVSRCDDPPPQLIALLAGLLLAPPEPLQLPHNLDALFFRQLILQPLHLASPREQKKHHEQIVNWTPPQA